jgi:hypothetical protein
MDATGEIALLPNVRCPHCQRNINVATGVSSNEIKFGVCVYCSSFVYYDGKLLFLVTEESMNIIHKKAPNLYNSMINSKKLLENMHKQKIN